MNASLRVATLLVLTAGTLLSLASSTLEAQDPEKLPHVKPPAEFEQLKQLVGEWEGTETAGNEEKKKVAVHYALTAAGTAVVEKLFPGEPHEMFSIYHGNGSDILMTHYCALGNQPRMRLMKSDRPKVLKFVYQDGTSMQSVKDPHMHQLTMTLEGKDRLTHEWVFYADGKQARVVQFDLKRKK